MVENRYMTHEELKKIAERTIKKYGIEDDMSWYSFYSLSGKEDSAERTVIDMDYNDLFIRVKNTFSTDIGLCGCGRPLDTWEMIHRYLKALKLRSESVDEGIEEVKNFYMQNYGLAQFMAYILDDREYTEHGTSIYGAWLTDKGKDLLSILDIYMNEDIESDVFGD